MLRKVFKVLVKSHLLVRPHACHYLVLVNVKQGRVLKPGHSTHLNIPWIQIIYDLKKSKTKTQQLEYESLV